MAENNQALATQIAAQGGKMTPLVIQGTLEKWKEQHAEKLVALAGSAADADKVYTICMNTVARNPALLECDFSTIANCILQSFQLGLYPGPFQECAFVPIKGKAEFWPQYPGIVKLILNAGNKCVIARVVRENDYFEYREGLQQPLYAPATILGKKRGKRLFAYAAICTRHGLWQVEVMDPDQIAVIKSRSHGAKTKFSPWCSEYEDDVDAMWAKSVLKRAAKWCTKSSELVAAIQQDNNVDGDAEISVQQRQRIVDMPLGSSEAIEGVSEKKQLPDGSVS